MTHVCITHSAGAWHATLGDPDAYHPVQLQHNALRKHFQVAHDPSNERGAGDEQHFRAALMVQADPEIAALAQAKWGEVVKEPAAEIWNFEV